MFSTYYLFSTYFRDTQEGEGSYLCMRKMVRNSQNLTNINSLGWELVPDPLGIFQTVGNDLLAAIVNVAAVKLFRRQGFCQAVCTAKVACHL